MPSYPYDPESSHYAGKPVDPNTVYNRQAQLYYQQQREKSGYDQKDPLRTGFSRTASYWQNAKEVMNPYPDVKSREQRTYAAHRRAAYRGIGDNTVEAVGNFAAPIGDVAMAEGLGYAGGSVGGVVGGIAGYMAGSVTDEAAGEYLGANRMARQFSRIDDLQAASSKFMAGTASGDPFTGRAQRDEAKSINDYIEKYTEMKSAYEEGDVSLDDIRKEVAHLSENKILEDVKSAEDFAKKFTALKDGVKRMTEVLGKTFEEGSEILGQYRDLGMDPSSAMGMVENINMMGTMSGSGFDKTNAAGMQAGLQLQGTGLTPEAAVTVGARAETSGEQIYQNRGGPDGMDERTVYNLGGKQGIKQRLQQMAPRMMQSPFMKRAMMASFNGDEISSNKMEAFARGEISPMDAFDNIENHEDMLEFRARYKKKMSEMIEDDPVNASAMMLQSAGAQLKNLGMTFGSKNQLNRQMADMLGVGMKDIKLMRQQIKNRNVGKERAKQRRIAEGRGRAQRDYGNVRFRPLTESGPYQDFVEFGERSGEFLSDNAYDASRQISDHVRYMTSGRRRIPETSQLYASYAAGESEEEVKGGVYKQAGLGDIWNQSDNTDLFNEMKSRQFLDEESIQKVTLRSTRDGSGEMSVTQGTLDKIGASQEVKESILGTGDDGELNQTGRVESVRKLGQMTGNQFVEDGSRHGGSGYQVVDTETLEKATKKEKVAAQFGRGVRSHLSTGLNELSDAEKTALQHLEKDMIPKLQGEFGDKIKGDSLSGGQELQNELSQSGVEAVRKVFGEDMSRKAALRKAQKISGVHMSARQDEFSGATQDMGQRDLMGTSQGSLLEDSKQFAEDFVNLTTKAPEQVGDISTEFLEEQYGLNTEKAEKLQSRISTKARLRSDHEYAETSLSDVIKESGEELGMESVAKKLASRTGDSDRAKRLREMGDDIADSEKDFHALTQYAQLKLARENGNLEDYEERTGKDFGDMEKEAYGIVGGDYGKLSAFVDQMRKVDPEKRSGYRVSIGDASKGTQQEETSQGTRVQAQQDKLEKQIEMSGRVLKQLEQLIDNRKVEEEKQTTLLEGIKRKIGSQ